MRKFGTAIVFLSGLAIGGAAVWYYTKDKYAQIAEEEINSVKEAYVRFRQNKAPIGDSPQDDDSVEAAAKTSAVSARVAEKESISEYARRIKNGEPMDYSKTVVPPKPEVQVAPAKSENYGDIPYVISPDEFDELDGYTPVSLTYFADGVLADEYGVVVDDIEEIAGDALNHFGEYEEDSVFVRNDAKRCDYEILRDERTYDEFRETLPPNI